MNNDGLPNSQLTQLDPLDEALRRRSQRATALPEPSQPKNLSLGLGDYARLVGKGAADLAGGTGDVARAGADWLQSKGATGAIASLPLRGAAAVGELADAAGERLEAGLSDDAREAMSRRIFDEDENGDLTLGDGAGDIDVWAAKMAHGLGSLIPTLGSGAAANVTTKIGGMVYQSMLKRGASDAIARATAQRTTQLLAEKAGTTAAVTAGAAGAVGLGARDVSEQVMAAPHEQLMESPTYQQHVRALLDNPQWANRTPGERLEEARRLTAEEASGAAMTDPGSWAFAAGAAILGDRVLYKMLAGKAAAGGVAAGAGKGALAEGVTEAVQEGGQQWRNNEILNQHAAADIDPTQGVLSGALEGGLIGAGVGGVVGGAGGAIHRGGRAEPAAEPNAEPGADPLADMQGDPQPGVEPVAGDPLTDMQSEPVAQEVSETGDATRAESNPLGPSPSEFDEVRDIPAYLRRDTELDGREARPTWEDNEVQQALRQGSQAPTVDELVRQQAEQGQASEAEPEQVTGEIETWQPNWRPGREAKQSQAVEGEYVPRNDARATADGNRLEGPEIEGQSRRHLDDERGIGYNRAMNMPGPGGSVTNPNYVPPLRERQDRSVEPESMRDSRMGVGKAINEAGAEADAIWQQLQSLRVTKRGQPFGSEKEARLASRKDETPVRLPEGYGIAKTEEVAQLQARQPTSEPIQPDEPVEQNSIGGMPIIEAPVAELALSEDVPQFKDGANKQGVVEPLGGKYDRTGAAPIQLWKRKSGKLEVISGRHRLDLAKRSGEQTIPAQIHDEDAGFDQAAAATLDAELNIRDNQGKVKDYVTYFKNTGISRDEADRRGYTARNLGRRAYEIATGGSEETIAAHRAGILSDDAAERISRTAPQDARLQSVGIKAVQEGKSIAHATNMMQAVKALGQPQGDGMGDMFGFDDSAMREAEQMARTAARKQREIADLLRPQKAVKSAGKLAEQEGITDNLAPEQRDQRMSSLQSLKSAWDNWSTNPELVAELRREIRGEEAPALSSYSEQDLQQQADQLRQAQQQERQAQSRYEADQEVDDFRLSGSAAPADVAMSYGQNDMFTQTLGQAEQIKAARAEVNPAPTEAQKEAGNYKKGHVKLQGLDIDLENPKGSTRSGTDSAGKPWESTMAHDYGYIKRTEGADGDHVDVFLGDNPDSQQVYVVNQVDPATGKFDEHKVMLGFDSEQAARAGYLANYQPGWKGLGEVQAMSVEEFKRWLSEGDTTKPVTGTAPAIEQQAAERKAKQDGWQIAASGVTVAVPVIDQELVDGYNRSSHIGDGRDLNAELKGEAESLLAELAGKQHTLDTDEQKAESAELINDYLQQYADFHRWNARQAISNPSWFVTGRDGRNMKKANAANERYNDEHSKRVEKLQQQRDRIARRLYDMRPNEDRAEQEKQASLKRIGQLVGDIAGYMRDGKGGMEKETRGWASPKVFDAITKALDLDRERAAREITKLDGALQDVGGLVKVLGPRSKAGKLASELLTTPAQPEKVSFSQQATADGKPAKGLTAKEADMGVREWLKQYQGAGGVTVTVHATQTEFDQALGLTDGDQYIRRAAFDSDGRALHIVAENIDSPKRLREILRHEVLAHYGLEHALGFKEYTQLMSRVRASRNDRSMKAVWDWVDAHYPDAAAGDKAEEVIAHLAELEPSQWRKGWDRVVNWVLTALRNRGFLPKGKISDSEIRVLLEGIGRKLKGNSDGNTPKGGDRTAMLFSAERAPWGRDFPEVILHGKLGDATSHPDYEAAKGGDDAAALRLVRDVLSPGAIRQLKQIIGDRQAIALAVHAEEAVSRNAIPRAMADILSTVLDIDVDMDIVQSAKVGRTAQDGFGRLANQPGFDGPVRTDKPYLIMDDTLTQGGTLANLKGYIENRGGKVLAATALTGKQYSAKIAIDESTLQQLRNQYDGTGLEAWWQNRFGYGFDSLTESEARYLLRAKDADKIRDRVSTAGQSSSSQGERGDAEGNGSLPPDGLKFSQTADSALDKLNLGPKPDVIDKAKEKLQALRELDRKTATSWLTRVGRKANTELLDALAPIKYLENALGIVDADNSGYIAARLATGSSSTMLGAMLHGIPVWKDGIIQRKAGTGEADALLGILQPLGKDLHNWLGWMAGHRAEILMAQGRENLLTAEEIQALKDLGKGKEQQFLEAKRKWNTFNGAILDLAQEAGLVSAEARAGFESEWYIPFFRETEDGDVLAPFSSKGIANQRAGIKQLKGGSNKTNDLLENMFHTTSKMIDAAMKNHAARKTVENLMDTGIIEVIENPNLLDMRAKDKGKEVFSFRHNGQDVYARTLDEDLFKAMTFLDRKPFDDPFTKVGMAAKRLLTATVTSSPEFMLRNFLRDALSAWTISKDKYNPLDAFKGAARAYKVDQNTLDMMFAGASFMGGYVNAQDPQAMADTVRKALRRKGMSPEQITRYEKSLIRNAAQAKGVIADAWAKYNRYGEAAENATREAVFEAAVKAGKSKAQAAFEAKDLMDFSMLGSARLLQWFVSVLPFFNARIQGLGKLSREFKDNPIGIAKRGGMLMAGSLALLAMNWDNEEYERLPDWDKDMNWHFWLGDQHFRIPKPFEVGVIFGTIPERMTRAMGDKDTGAEFGRAVARAVGETFALNPIPQVVNPIVEVYANYDSFTGRAIENQYEQTLMPQARYDERTSQTMRELGELTGMSPKQLEHLITGYLGTMGAYALMASDGLVNLAKDEGDKPATRLHEWPIIKAVYQGDGSTPARSTKHLDQLYRMLGEVTTLHNTVTSYRKDNRIEDANQLIREGGDILRARKSLTQAQRQLRQLRNQMDLIRRDKTLNAEQKRERIDRLLTRRNDLAARVVEQNRKWFE